MSGPVDEFGGRRAELNGVDVEAELADATKAEPKKTLSGRSALILLICCALVALGGVTFSLWSAQNLVATQAIHSRVLAEKKQRDAQRAAEQRAEDEAEARQAALEAEQAAARQKQSQDDARAVANGFEPAGNGIYIKFIDPSKFQCGYLNCTYVAVTTSSACSAGVYVAASVMRSSVSVGAANGITAGLDAWGVAVLQLQDTTGAGDSYQLTDAHCLG